MRGRKTKKLWSYWSPCYLWYHAIQREDTKGLKVRYTYYMYTDPLKHKEFMRKWYQDHKEAVRLKQKKYEAANKEKISVTKKVWRQRPEVALDIRIRSLKRYHDSPEYRKRSLELSAERRKKHRSEIVKLLGGCCQKCGFTDARALQVDHVNGGGRKEFREKPNLVKAKVYLDHIKKNRHHYQMLCANCNWIKRFTNKEIPNYR